MTPQLPKAQSRLEAYVPRVAIEWPSDAPSATYRVVEGSLVFVDISGFTALSEKLAARGRIGAEELTDAISTCFAGLLAVAYADAGSLLKFGGDALLLYFEGEDHAGRACRSAIRMRQRLRTVGKLATTVGTVRLRMSVGINSGPLHLFRVGRSHKEFILTGPGATGTVEMEQVAEAGEILVSDATAALIDASLLGERKGPGTLLRDRSLPAVPETFPARAPVPEDLLVEALPVALREHLLDGGGDSEHRHAAIGFVHFDGIDALIATHGPEDVARGLDELVVDAQEAATAHGVTFLATDIDKDGGKIILTAGVPRVLGDDDGRLLRAVRQIADRERLIPVRIGVNRGHVFAGEVGPAFRRTYTIMGDAVNLAARLMAAAAPGQILVSSSTLALSRTAFETTALEPIRVKGKSQPVEPFALGPIKGTQQTRASAMLPLVGREEELATMVKVLADVTTGTGRVIELTGETGLGKSRLLAELRATAIGIPTTTITCEQYEQSTPFYVAKTLLCIALRIADPLAVTASELTEIVRGVAPTVLPYRALIGEVLGIGVPETEATESLEPRYRRERTTRATAELLEGAWPDAQVLAFEDVHWIDDASSPLLDLLARTAGKRPWLLVTTRRDEESGFRAPDGAHVTKIELAPLDETSAEQLIEEATADAPIPPHASRALVARSGGNPLFLEELLRVGSDVDALPDSLEAVMALQVDSLPPADRRLLRYAAVLGMNVEVDILAHLSGDALRVDEQELRARLGSFLLDEGERFRFRHRMLRDVAYQGLPFNTRRELHGRAGDALERACGDARFEKAEVLSLHFLHARRFDKCWLYARSAADRAQETYANVEAVELYERALVAAKRLSDLSPGEIALTWEHLGEVAMQAGSYARARNAFREARRLRRNDPVAYAILCLWQSRLSDVEGQGVASIRWIRRGLKAMLGIEGVDASRQRAQMNASLAFAYRQQGRPKRALAFANAALEEARAGGHRSPLADASYALDLAYFDLGRPDLAVNSKTALPVLEELGEYGKVAVFLNALGGFSYFQGKWAEAVDYYGRSQAAFERIGNLLEGSFAKLNMGEILADQGRLDDAEHALRDVLKLWRSLDYPYGVALAQKHLGRVAMRRGDTEEALSLFEEARTYFAEQGAEGQRAEIDARIAEGRLRMDEPGAALSIVEELFKQQQATGATGSLSMLHRIAAYARRARGDVDGARADAEAAVEIARARNDAYELSFALEAVAIVTGDQTHQAERRSLLSGLDVVETPPPPVEAGGGGVPLSVT